MGQIICGDCLEIMLGMADNSVDLIFGSPPYESARTYGIDFKLKGQAWVDWMVELWLEMNRVCKGLVAMVVEGQTRGFRWSATPALLMADLHRAGIRLRKPPAFKRVGICGSGGPDWLRNDYEFIICSSHGKLPWSDNTAMGKSCKWGIGGAMSHRVQNGERIMGRSGKRSGDSQSIKRLNGNTYQAPEIANPGNIITCSVGGGRMGSKYAHENEAPFPEKLVEFFIRSFCRPGGTVMDTFSGSGTVAAVAARTGREYIAIDIRQSQCDLARKRLSEVQAELYQ